jgi:hypothetical protein
MSFWSNLFADAKIGGFLAVAIGLGFLVAIAFYAWRVVGSGIRRNAGRGSRPPRLGLVDSFDLDRHRQLVIIRRDNVEHLIMIGGPNDLVIEQAIVRAQPAGAERREPSAPLTGSEIARAPAVEVKTPVEPPPPPPMAPPPLRPAIEPEAASVKPPLAARPAPSAPSRPSGLSSLAASRPAGVMPPPLRPASPPRPPLGSMPAPAVEPAIAPLTPPPPPASEATGEISSPPPIVPSPAPPPSETLVEATRPPPPRADQLSKEIPRFAVNIDSLEEEMAKLLGRPQDSPKKS